MDSEEGRTRPRQRRKRVGRPNHPESGNGWIRIVFAMALSRGHAQDGIRRRILKEEWYRAPLKWRKVTPPAGSEGDVGYPCFEDQQTSGEVLESIKRGVIFFM